MQTLQHVCGQMVNVTAWQSHGETILEMQDPDTGAQIERCPDCGDEVTGETLFPLDFFPEVYAEMAEQVVEF